MRMPRLGTTNCGMRIDASPRKTCTRTHEIPKVARRGGRNARRERSARGSHLRFTPQPPEGTRHETAARDDTLPRGSVSRRRLILGFRGSLEEWEPLLGAAPRRDERPGLRLILACVEMLPTCGESVGLLRALRAPRVQALRPKSQ